MLESSITTGIPALSLSQNHLREFFHKLSWFPLTQDSYLFGFGWTPGNENFWYVAQANS